MSLRIFVKAALWWSTLVLLGAVIFVPESINGADFLSYAGLWAVGLWMLKGKL
jgi:hypothetical protein